MIGRQKIQCLLFADDVVLIAEEANELQQMIAILEKYTSKNKLKVNVEKTKIMVCKGEGEEKRKKNGYGKAVK